MPPAPRPRRRTARRRMGSEPHPLGRHSRGCGPAVIRHRALSASSVSCRAEIERGVACCRVRGIYEPELAMLELMIAALDVARASHDAPLKERRLPRPLSARGQPARRAGRPCSMRFTPAQRSAPDGAPTSSPTPAAGRGASDHRGICPAGHWHIYASSDSKLIAVPNSCLVTDPALPAVATACGGGTPLPCNGYL